MLVECNVLLASVRPPARRLRRVRHRRSLLQLSAAAGQASDERRAHRHNSLPAEQTLVRGRVQDPGNVEVAPLAKLAPSSCEPALRFDRWPSGYAAHVVSKHTNRGYAGIALGAVLVIVAFVAALTGPRRRALPEILTASGRSRSPLLSPVATTADFGPPHRSTHRPPRAHTSERGACRGPRVARSVIDRLHRASRLRPHARQSQAVATEGHVLHSSGPAR